MNWDYLPFEKVLKKVTYTPKIPKKKFMDCGTYPIVSQEIGEVNGYWNNSDDLFRVNNPVVIFGDHTKIVKLIDFDFVLGADGVKILDPIEHLNAKFFAYFLQSIRIRELGYARHYKLLKEFNVPIPSLEEQKRIVTILDKVFADIEKARATAETNLKNARELMDVTYKAAISGKLTELWRDGNENIKSADELFQELKKQKKQLVNEKVIKKEKEQPTITETQAPYEVPKNWKWCFLGEIGNAINFPFVDGPFGSSINTKTDYVESGVPVLRMANVKPFVFKNDNLKFVTEAKYQQFTRHNVLPGDVLFSKVGAGIGESCVVPDDFSYGMLSTTGITRIRVGQIVLNQYLCCFLNANIEAFKAIGNKAAQPFLNMNQIKTFPFPLAPIEEQREIVSRIELFSFEINSLSLIYKKKLDTLDELKKSILQKAFTGELTKSKGIAA